MAYENRHDGSDRDRCVPRERFDPTDVELLPRLSVRLALARNPALPRPMAVTSLVEVATRGPGLDESDGTVRERQSASRG